MARRSDWLAARAAGLLTIADLEVARQEVEDARPKFAGAAPAIASSMRSWELHREALLYRPGTAPSGVNAERWLRLAELFRELGRASAAPEPFAKADQTYDELLTILAVFRNDGHAFPTVVRNMLHLGKRA